MAPSGVAVTSFLSLATTTFAGVEEVKSNWSGKNRGNIWPSHTHF